MARGNGDSGGIGMHLSLLPLLRCPNGCEPHLRLCAPHSDGNLIEMGSLECGGCGAEYLVEEGIPRLLPRALADNAPDRRSDPQSAIRNPQSAIEGLQLSE